MVLSRSADLLLIVKIAEREAPSFESKLGVELEARCGARSSRNFVGERGAALISGDLGARRLKRGVEYEARCGTRGARTPSFVYLRSLQSSFMFSSLPPPLPAPQTARLHGFAPGCVRVRVEVC